MDGQIQWWGWLLAGMAVGTASGLGKSGLSGVLVGIAVLCSPVVIFMKAGAAVMPFALFYGGLVVMTSLLFRRRRARENQKIDHENELRKKRMGLR